MIIQEEKKDVLISSENTVKTFSIKASAKAFQILSSNIYTHKVRAVIREICSNAADSHTEAKNKQPFDVHLPTWIEQWFSVRDYGTGISHENMMTLYTTYFYSTRDNSNDFVGALGIGRVAPFSITDSFVVESFYEGFKRTYSCFKNSSGEPSIILLGEVKSDEPSGMNIKVDLASFSQSEWENEAFNVFRFFEETPNINLSAIKGRIEEWKKSLHQFAGCFWSTSLNCNYAVMGNVAYEYKNDSFKGLILKFDIGELDFNPGRETLSLNEATKQNLENKITECKKFIKDELDKEYDLLTPFQKYIQRDKFFNGPFGNLFFQLHKAPVLEGKDDFLLFSKRSYRNQIEVDFIKKYNGSIPIFVYNDTKFNCEKLLKRYVKDINQNVLLVTQNNIKELGMTDSDYINYSKIREEYSTRSSKVGISYKNSVIGKFYKIDKSKENHDNFRYLPHVTELDSSKTHYYVISISNHTNVFNSTYGSNIHVIASFLKSINSDEIIYVISPSTVRSKEFKKMTNLVSFDQFVLDKTKNLTKIEYNEPLDFYAYDSYLIHKIAEKAPKDSYFDVFRNFVKEKEIQKCHILNVLNLYNNVTTRKDLYKKINEIELYQLIKNSSYSIEDKQAELFIKYYRG